MLIITCITRQKKMGQIRCMANALKISVLGGSIEKTTPCPCVDYILTFLDAACTCSSFCEVQHCSD